MKVRLVIMGYVKQLADNLVVPVGLATLLFMGIRPVVDRLVLAAAPIAISSVGTDIIDGYQQVYYIDRGNKVYITSGSRNHYSPAFDGDWVVYDTSINGAGQVFLYSASSATTTQLTYTGTNQKMKLDAGRAVWERWVDDRWQVYFYDGSTVRQITSGDVSVRPDIEGDTIVYAQQSSLGAWTAYQYTISLGVTVSVGTGDAAAWPRLVNGQVVLGFSGL